MQTLSTKLKKTLYGKSVNTIHDVEGRVTHIAFPRAFEGDKHREIFFPADDGLILYLLKRIEALEEKVTVPGANIQYVTQSLLDKRTAGLQESVNRLSGLLGSKTHELTTLKAEVELLKPKAKKAIKAKK